LTFTHTMHITLMWNARLLVAQQRVGGRLALATHQVARERGLRGLVPGRGGADAGRQQLQALPCGLQRLGRRVTPPPARLRGGARFANHAE